MADGPKPPITVVIPPPVWALLFTLLGWGAGRFMNMNPIPALEQPIHGAILLIAGIALSSWGRLIFARAGTEVLPASPTNKLLVTEGPFRFTRNPMYLGILTALIGVAFLIGTIPVFISALVFFLFVNFVSIPFEERKMERQFGDSWRAYVAKVRRWI